MFNSNPYVAEMVDHITEKCKNLADSIYDAYGYIIRSNLDDVPNLKYETTPYDYLLCKRSGDCAYFELDDDVKERYYIVTSRVNGKIDYRLVRGKCYLLPDTDIHALCLNNRYEDDDVDESGDILEPIWNMQFIYYYMKYCSKDTTQLCEDFPICSLEKQKLIVNAVEAFNIFITDTS